MVNFLEVFVILSISRVNQIILIFLRITFIAIISITLTPWLTNSVLLTISPVTREVHVQTQILKSMNFVIHLYVTHVIIRVCFIRSLIQQSYRVGCGITVLGYRPVWIIQSSSIVSPSEVVIEQVIATCKDWMSRIHTVCSTNSTSVSITSLGIHELTINIKGKVIIQEAWIQIQAGSVTLIVGSLQCTILVGVTQRKTIRNMLETTSHSHIVVSADSSTINFLVPICISSS